VGTDSQKFKNVELDYSVVMPNHFHGIVALVGPSEHISINTKTGGHAGYQRGEGERLETF
jgi:REP element-mobilizing transposase RayT